LTTFDSEKAVPLSLLMEFAADPEALLTITRLLQYLSDVRKHQYTGELRLDCKDGLAREFRMTLRRRLDK